MVLVVPLKILLLFLLLLPYLPKIVNSSEFHSIGDEQTPFLIDICKVYAPKSVVFLYAESIKEMEMTTLMFKWIRALFREGIASTNLYFSQLNESSYYLKQTIRPYFVALISNFNAINEFSLATSTFDMSSAVWLVIFIYKENAFNYCHNPPSNIFHLTFNTEMMVRCGTENILREWYSIDTNQIEINDIATWSLERGITKMVPDFIYQRRNNLKGFIMRAVTIKGTPFINIRKDDELDNMFYEVLREICVTLNFSFYVASEVIEYGRWNPEEKTWTGAIAELYTGRADISLARFSITKDRLNAVDFTFPHLVSRNYLYIHKPEIFTVKWSSYFQTFTNSVWMAMFGVFIVAWILLTFLKMKYGTDRKIGYLLVDNFMEIWGIVCQQGLIDFSGRSSLRITYISLFLLVTVFWASYSATSISILTSVINVLPFHSFRSFVADGTYQLAVPRGTSYYDKFANSKDPLAKKIMKLMLEEEKLPISEFEGFKIVCENRKLAMYTSDKLSSIGNLKMPCDIIRIETGHRNSFAMVLSKHNPFTDLINFQLQKFIDYGMINRLKYKSSKKEPCDMIKHQPVPLISIISLLLFFSIGIVLSICILIVEKYIFVRKGKEISLENRVPSIKSSVLYIKRKESISNVAINYANQKCAYVSYIPKSNYNVRSNEFLYYDNNLLIK